MRAASEKKDGIPPASAGNGRARPSPESAPRSPGAEAVDLLTKLYMAARRHSQRLKARHGVTATQLGVLKLLHRRGPLTQSALAALLMVKGSTVSGLVDRLERDGLVDRLRGDGDRRSVKVVLSAKAAGVARRVPHQQLGHIKRLLDRLPDREVGQFVGTLRRIVEEMRARDEVAVVVDELLDDTPRR
ncbi:MAG: MarR family transcriptional regulator [Planctomycetes bacterium]|nr:MarR family transcriptional regulator [Planctomycetota bacterium]